LEGNCLRVALTFLVNLDSEGVEKTIAKGSCTRARDTSRDLINQLEDMAVEYVNEVQLVRSSIITWGDSSVVCNNPLLILKTLNAVKECSMFGVVST